MEVGDYVLFEGTAWRVIKKYSRGTLQIQPLSQTLSPLESWINNAEVYEKYCDVITKEVADVFRCSRFM